MVYIHLNDMNIARDVFTNKLCIHLLAFLIRIPVRPFRDDVEV